MLSARSQALERQSLQRGEIGYETQFLLDYHTAAAEQFAHLPQAQRLARAMAYAITRLPVVVYPEDGIGGRVYYRLDKKPKELCPATNDLGLAEQEFAAVCPEAEELLEHQLLCKNARGHITWLFDRILTHGTEGYKAIFEKALSTAKDQKAAEFYEGVCILLDALQTFNDKHIAAYEAVGNFALAERMKKVPRYPAETFLEAVQAFYMQHIVVMRENPYGGNSPGRLDYYLWPYLERDLAAGRCTLEEARQVIDELFLRINERVHKNDMWVEAVMVGGTNPDGTSSVNPLTYIMIESIIDLNITHPSVYVRLPENPPQDLGDLSVRYLLSGNNRAQILYDPAVIGAITQNGVPYQEAVQYACGGCMEVSVQGMTSDFLFNGYQNIPKMLELMVTGGRCLLTGKQLSAFRSEKGLAGYDTFEDFYRDFIKEAERLVHLCLQQQDIYGAVAETHRPSYLISSMIEDCLARGRNMHGGGARYDDYGIAPLGLPNVADGLYAIKTAVFDQKICTAETLIAAMQANFVGYERLQQALRNIPRYGMDQADADQMANRVMQDFADMYLGFRSPRGGRGKPVILTFVYSPTAAKVLGATPDGRKAHSGIAYGVTPANGSMTEGITAAINSCGKMPFSKFAGGASTMWDFDPAWAKPEIVETLLQVFMEKGGQIFQGNTTDLEELLDAREHPENYGHLMVRVGGYSARFIHLSPELQQEVINRMRHKA